MQKLTQEQALAISGFTGILACKFSDFHEDVEKRLGRPVWTHEFGTKALMLEVKEAYRQDFLDMI